MSLDALLRAVDLDAGEAIERVLAEARAEAERIAADSQARIERRRVVAKAALEAEMEAEAGGRLAEERHRARTQILEARERLLQRVVRACEQRFADAMRSEAYAGALPRLLDRALELAGERGATIRCAEMLGEPLGRLLEGRARVSVVTDPSISGGFEAVAEDASLTVDATLGGALARRRAAVRIEAIRRLALEPREGLRPSETEP